MDLFNELYRLPYFFYVVGDEYKLLGGHETKPDNPMTFSRIYDLWEKMMETYKKEQLSDDDKIYLANSMKKMRLWCEGRNMKKEELKSYVNGLSPEAQYELETQIQMYKDSRDYYGRYIYNK